MPDINNKGGLNLPLYNLEPKRIGNSYFLGIGINNYKESAGFPNLFNAQKDIEDILELLQSKYDVSTPITLFNENATREQIIHELDQLSELIRPIDKLIIYFSGHGHINKRKKGFWIPYDANKKNTANYIRNSTILNYVGDINSLHTLLISDSCNSGSIFDLETFRSTSPAIEELEKIKSRWAICSGLHSQLVSDGKPGCNSPFANSLINSLKVNNSPKINAGKIVDKVIKATSNIYKQLPIGSRLDGVGDEGGQYIFVLKNDLRNADSNGKVNQLNLTKNDLRQGMPTNKINYHGTAPTNHLGTQINKLEYNLDRGHINDCIKELLFLTNKSNLIDEDEILNLQIRLKKLETDNRKGILEYDKYTVHRNVVVENFLYYYRVIKSELDKYEKLEEMEEIVTEEIESIESIISENGTPDQKQSMMKPTQKLVRAYLSLSHTVRLKIAMDIGIYSQEDNKSEKSEQTKVILLRAKKEEKLRLLWKKVMESIGNSEMENPF